MNDPNDPHRFNEERATYVLRGSDSEGERPDFEAGIAVIKGVVRLLKAVPGVYRMVDARGDVLYVGKARALTHRVNSYTQPNRLPIRLQRMVAQTRSMEIVTTNSEAEALLLESQLIKRFRPAYNVLLRDDKRFPFILVRDDHDYPRIQKHRGARRAKGQYFGPFASGGAVNLTLNAMQKLFLLRSCTDSFFANRDRPCLLYQIKRCSAPCVGRVSAGDYAELVDDAIHFLSGRSTQTQAKLGGAMAEASARLDYEMAAVYRDRLKALTFIQGSQAINAAGLGDVDIFAMATQGGTTGITGFFIRAGLNWGHRSFFPANTAGVEGADIMANFLIQFYEAVPPPRLILVNHEPRECALVMEALTSLAEHKIIVSVPQRGDRAALMEQAARNAAESLDRRLAENTTQAKAMCDLADLFDLPEPPRRIEVYDNSHIQGTSMVGAMIVAGPEGYTKGAYRKWTIKRPDTAPGDDYAMMREVFSRRFARAQSEDPDRVQGDWPDLVLVDGGKGQMSAARAALEELGIEDVAMVGVAKGPHHGREGREIFHLPDGREVTLPPGAPALFHIQRLRDEAHRFAIGAHRQKRAKAMTSSPLDDVPGIGPARKKALLMHFGTARAVRNASLDDIQRAPGVSSMTAQAVYDFYHG